MATLHWPGKLTKRRPKKPVRKPSLTSTQTLARMAAEGNLLVLADNEVVLRCLVEQGFPKIDCIIADPPFNSGRCDLAYPDRFPSQSYGGAGSTGHDAWLSYMQPRLKMAYDILDDSGTFWISINDIEYAYLKVLLDEIFGPNRYLGTLVWERYRGRISDVGLSVAHEYLVGYCKQQLAQTKERLADGAFAEVWQTGAPSLRSWLSAAEFGDADDARNALQLLLPSENLSAFTPKPEEIPYLILACFTKPGAQVLDIFCGSGTVGAVALKSSRRFIIVERFAESFNVAERRLDAVVSGKDTGTLSRKLGWRGGGSFASLRL